MPSRFSPFSRGRVTIREIRKRQPVEVVANLLVAIHNAAAAEAMVLGKKAGSPAKPSSSGGGRAPTSRMFEVRGPYMVAGDTGTSTMKVEVWQKDMKIIGEFAAALGADAAVQRFRSALQRGHGARLREGRHRERLCVVLERMAGLRRPLRRLRCVPG